MEHFYTVDEVDTYQLNELFLFVKYFTPTLNIWRKNNVTDHFTMVQFV